MSHQLHPIYDVLLLTAYDSPLLTGAIAAPISVSTYNVCPDTPSIWDKHIS